MRDRDKLAVGGGLLALVLLALRSSTSSGASDSGEPVAGGDGGGGGGDGLDPVVLALTAGWRWPVEPIDTQRFPAFADGAQRYRYPQVSDHFGWSPRRGRDHVGVDISFKRSREMVQALPDRTKRYDFPDGIRILAAGPGKVSVSSDIDGGGYVRAWHRGDLVTQYMHLSKRLVKQGDTIEAGQPIGVAGFDTRPGAYRFRHLHFELLRDGKVAINPEPYMRFWVHTFPTTTGVS